MKMSATGVASGRLNQPVPAQWTFVLLYVGYGLALVLAVAHEQWLLAAAVFAVPLVMLRPVEYSLGLFAALVPFDTIAVLSHQSGGPGSSINWYVGAAAGAVLLTAGLAGGRLASPPKAALYWGALVVWGTIVVGWAPEPQVALQRVPTAFALLLLYLAAASLRITRTELFWVAVLTVVGGAVAAIYAAAEYHHGVNWVGGRASLIVEGRTTDPNVLAASQLLPFSLALGGAISARNRLRKMASFAALSVITYGLLLEMSRGALVSVFVVVLVFMWRYRVNWPGVIAWVNILAVLALAAPSDFFARMQTGLSSRASGRFDVWHVGVYALRDWWYRGAGFDNFRIVYAKHAGQAPVFGGYISEAHELFLGVAVELGILGLVLLLAAIVSQLRSARAFVGVRGHVDFPLGVACEGGCWGMLVMSLSLDTLWLKAFWLNWILLAVAIRTWRSEQSAALA